MKKLIILSMLILVSIGANAQRKISLEEAQKIVEKNYKEKNNDNLIYCATEIVKGKSKIEIGKKSISTPEKPSWFFFIDNYPSANWGHSCKYIFIDVQTGKSKEIKHNMPPNILKDMKLLSEKPKLKELEKLDFKNSPNSLGCAATVNHNYAVIISGGYDKFNNHIRYYNDCQAIFNVLKNVYHYQQSHIYVLMSDGTNTATDRSDGTNSPIDLDGDGTNDVTFSATTANITSVFNTLQGILTPSDHLFVFTTDHGGSTTWGSTTSNTPCPSGGAASTGTNSGNSTLNLWNYEEMTDTAFATEVNKVKAGQMTIVMEQCYSGGFIENLSAPGRVIITAAKASEVSWGGATYDPFVYEWTRAVGGTSPSSADVNSDGVISIKESFDYAKSQDTTCEEPMYSSNPSNFGDNLTLNGVRGADLWSQDTPEDIGIESNNISSTLYISKDIWVRNSNDGFTNQVHQNPIFHSITNQPNYVYVRVRNRGCDQAPPTTVKLYWAKASTGLVWTAPWDGSQVLPGTTTPLGGIISAKLTNIINSGADQILEFSWNVPDPSLYSIFGSDMNHFCLLSRIETSNTYPFGMTTPESFFLWQNVANNNNIVWKNVSVITMANSVASVIVGNFSSKRIVSKLTFKLDRMLDLKRNGVVVELNEKLVEKIKKSKAILKGLKIEGNYLKIKSANAEITNLVFEPQELHTLTLNFKLNKYLFENKKSYNLEVNQFIKIENKYFPFGGEQFTITQ